MATTHEVYPLTEKQLRALVAPINPNRVAQRDAPGKGKKLSYLKAWDVRTALIRVFGFGGFSIEALDTSVVSFERDVPNKSGGTTAFRVTAMARVQLTIHQTGAVYTESAAASQAGSDPGEVTDFAIKTAVSDATKRCAMNLGTQFGLSLYDNGSTADVVKIVMAPEQEFAQGEFKGQTSLSPELKKQTEDFIARAMKTAEERDNARVKELTVAHEDDSDELAEAAAE